MNNRFIAIILSLLAVGLSACDKKSVDTTWPARPIKVIVPFGAGGGSDTFARQLIRSIASEGFLDQPMVVINVGGAGGTIGSRRVRHARPDGYTMLMLHEGLLTAHHAGRAPYGPDGFEAVAGTGRIDMVMAVKEDSSIKDLKQLMDATSADPKSLGFAANIGAPSHFGGLMLEKTNPGSVFKFVQFGGGADRFAAIAGGHVDLSIFSVEEFLRYREGGLRAIAVFATERHPAIPQVPTAQEEGFDVISSNMHFWWMPKGTPSSVREGMADAIEKAMATPQMQKFMADSWTEPVMLREEALQAELDARESSISQVSLRQIEVLPNFPAWIGGAIAVLMVLASLGYFRNKRSAAAITDDSPPVFNRLSLSCYLITGVYVLVLSMAWLAYPLATAIYIFVMGSLIASWRKSVMIPLGLMALIMGFGLFYIFTNVLVVDLPG
jgi:putative tricarboxylic transport membrane protein